MPVTTKWEERAKSSEHNFNIEHDKVVKLEADRNEWKSLYEDLHKLHADGKLDNSDKLLKENQRLREAIIKADLIYHDLGISVEETGDRMDEELQKALEK